MKRLFQLNMAGTVVYYDNKPEAKKARDHYNTTEKKNITVERGPNHRNYKGK